MSLRRRYRIDVFISLFIIVYVYPHAVLFTTWENELEACTGSPYYNVFKGKLGGKPGEMVDLLKNMEKNKLNSFPWYFRLNNSQAFDFNYETNIKQNFDFIATD